MQHGHGTARFGRYGIYAGIHGVGIIARLVLHGPQVAVDHGALQAHIAGRLRRRRRRGERQAYHRCL